MVRILDRVSLRSETFDSGHNKSRAQNANRPQLHQSPHGLEVKPWGLFLARMTDTLKEDSPEATESPEMSVKKPPGHNDGRFKSGSEWTGNKNGRPKGIKNRITVQRLLQEEELREQLAVNASQLMAKAILMAMDGNDRVMRALLDKLLATPKHSDDQDTQDRSVHVVIKNLTTPPSGAVITPALPNKVRVITTETPIEGEILKK